jgi:UDP-2-acetamido-2-deoxy-ribo-hexuluronate aminotransferase
MEQIQMVDLKGQYDKIKAEVDTAIQSVISTAAFIKGPAVKDFQEALSKYHNGSLVQACGNGTDALQLALMALSLQAGDEIITPAFTYFATVEVLLLLGLKPVFVDVDPHTFNIDVSQIEAAITTKTKAIVPVHLFGQASNMEELMAIAQKHNLYVIEDNAQSIGGHLTYSDGTIKKTGTIGHIGCTSFFPSKNLGAYGDGGAVLTNDEAIFQKLKAITNHGQNKKYYHELVGINSRLDTIQAAILNCKLPHLDTYNQARRAVAEAYNSGFAENNALQTPLVAEGVFHVYHQYTIKLSEQVDRTELKQQLAARGIPTMIYYPLPCHQQQALLAIYPEQKQFPNAELLSKTVLSLPIHTEMSAEQIKYIIEQVNILTQ